LITYCIDQVKGSLLWERSVFPDTLEEVHSLPGSPATPTPTTDGSMAYVYFAAYNGNITVVKPGDRLNVIARSDLREKIGSSPAALGKMLYIRTDSALYAFKK